MNHICLKTFRISIRLSQTKRKINATMNVTKCGKVECYLLNHCLLQWLLPRPGPTQFVPICLKKKSLILVVFGSVLTLQSILLFSRMMLSMVYSGLLKEPFFVYINRVVSVPCSCRESSGPNRLSQTVMDHTTNQSQMHLFQSGVLF